MSGIYWLASYPKSGNTWLRIFLTNYWRDADVPADINELDATPIASSRHIFDEYAGIDSADLTFEEIDRLRPAIYRHYAADNQDEARYCKVHDAYTCLPDGQPLFPAECTSGAIYILRNPLDVAVSYAHHNARPVEWGVEAVCEPQHTLARLKDGIAAQLHQLLLTWGEHVESWTSVKDFPVHLIRYEDMIADPLATFRGAINFIGEADDLARIEKAIRFSAFDELQRQEQEKGFKERLPYAEAFFRKGKVGGYREKLTGEQIAKIMYAHAAVLRKYGYLDEGGNLVY